MCNVFTFAHTVVEPNITVQPVDEKGVLPNESVTFSVTASGDMLTYQWFRVSRDGLKSQIVGATEEMYTIDRVGEEDEGMYFCLVSNDADSVNSTAAVLMLCKILTFLLGVEGMSHLESSCVSLTSSVPSSYNS